VHVVFRLLCDKPGPAPHRRLRVSRELVEDTLKPESRAPIPPNSIRSPIAGGSQLEQALTDSQNVSSIDDPHACESCGRAPARRLVIRRHVGMLYLQKFVKIEPTLCRECGTRTVMRYTRRTLVQGWWGLISLVIANPFTIVMNLVALVQARRLPPPQLSSI
jgi:hypothetical protein